MNNNYFWLAAFLGYSICFLPLKAQETSENDEAIRQSGRIRVGVYDSRAIAIAYAPSKFNPVREKMQQLQRAKAEGDQQQVQELEKWGQKHQRELHRQGFSFVPVNNLLEHVKDKLPEVARAEGVVLIARACDFTSADVEIVDVTERLVQLFEPSAKTLKFVADIRSAKPIDLDELDH